MNYKTNIKARKRIMIDTNTKIIESKRFKERHKWNWRQEIGKEIDADDLKQMGIEI
jgi:hypothetical protein